MLEDFPDEKSKFEEVAADRATELLNLTQDDDEETPHGPVSASRNDIAKLKRFKRSRQRAVERKAELLSKARETRNSVENVNPYVRKGPTGEGSAVNTRVHCGESEQGNRSDGNSTPAAQRNFVEDSEGVDGFQDGPIEEENAKLVGATPSDLCHLERARSSVVSDRDSHLNLLSAFSRHNSGGDNVITNTNPVFEDNLRNSSRVASSTHAGRCECVFAVLLYGHQPRGGSALWKIQSMRIMSLL